MTQRREVVEREIVSRREVEVLLQLAKELRLPDAVDAQIGLEIGVEFDHLRRITRLLDNEVDEKRFQLRRVSTRSCRYGSDSCGDRCSCRRGFCCGHS